MPACLSLRPHPTAQWSRSAAEALHSNCLALHQQLPSVALAVQLVAASARSLCTHQSHLPLLSTSACPVS